MSLLIMQKLSSTYRFKNFGETGVALIAVFFDFFHAWVGYYGASGATHSTTVNLFEDGVIMNKVVIGQHEIQ